LSNGFLFTAGQKFLLLCRRSEVNLLDKATRILETSPPQRIRPLKSIVCRQKYLFEFLAKSQRGSLSSPHSFGGTLPPQRSESARHGDPHS
jgi:hypothetical protein